MEDTLVTPSVECSDDLVWMAVVWAKTSSPALLCLCLIQAQLPLHVYFPHYTVAETLLIYHSDMEKLSLSKVRDSACKSQGLIL